MEDLLFLSHRIPFPPNKGDKIRSWHILKHLAERYRVHLGCLYDDPDDARHIPFLNSICASACFRSLNRRKAKIRSLTGLFRGEPLTLRYFRDEGLQSWVTETLSRRKPSRVFTFCSAMATYVRDDCSALRILDMIDLDSEKWRQYAGTKWPPMKQLYGREHRLLAAFERDIAEEFDGTLFVSGAEATRFAGFAPKSTQRVHVMRNGVDLEYFNPGEIYANPFVGDGPFAVFTGAMDYWPNIQAVNWFAIRVLPLVQRTWPNAEFWIVGRDPPRAVSRLASRSKRVHVTGTVDDIRPYINHASVVVAPLQIGCGVQNKVLEAMAMAKTVVASPRACEGIDVSNDQDILIAATPEAFASAIESVVSRKARANGHAARSRIERDYRWNFTMLDDLLDQQIPTRFTVETN